MKKTIIAFFLMMSLLVFIGCGDTNETESTTTQIGTSGFSIIIPEGFVETDDDFDEDQIAYYFKDDQSLDFDIYQWDKEGIYTLETEAAYFAAEYGVTPSEITINGINGMYYATEEDYDGISYTVCNYMFDDGNSIIELCFWTDNSDAELALVNEIINTLAKL